MFLESLTVSTISFKIIQKSAFSSSFFYWGDSCPRIYTIMVIYSENITKQSAYWRINPKLQCGEL